jgi:hypothetical protein
MWQIANKEVGKSQQSSKENLSNGKKITTNQQDETEMLKFFFFKGIVHET